MSTPVDEQVTVTVRGACPHDCPDTCAMLVSVRDGRAVEVRGDPGHPFTRGGLCVKVNNYVDKVYSPGRVLYPLRRTGPKGSGRFGRVSWDEALDEIAGRFRSSIAEHGAESIMPVSYLGTEGILNGLNVGDPFFNKLGATITERTYCDSGACTAYTMTIGATAGVDPESLVHSRYILIWACNMISTNLHLWPFVAEAQRRGAKVVVIDPVRHRTAAHADWYIPIRPGTDGALALAMMNVIIGEGLTDQAYVRDYTVGYDELAERVGRYTPEWAADKVVAGLSREDLFTVVSDHFLTDTARYADLVLPATTQLEQHDIMFSWGHFYVTLNTPAVEPLGEAIPNTELFRRLAARMGFTAECFTRTDEQMLAEAFDWSAPAMAGISLESLRRTGWARLNLPSADEYAPHAEGSLPTPSGKTEFRSSIAEQAGNFVIPLFRQGSNEFQPGGMIDPLPHYVPPRETADAGYRLNLISPKSHAYLNSSAGDQPAQRRVQGEQAVTVHPQDAAARGIADGQYVRVFNDRGQFAALARVTDEVARGVVMAPMGAWPKNAKGHATVNAVSPFVFADLGNAPTFSDTRVEIEPA
jgi:anaerobic selenocysteine-containing dehydrogenase